MILLYFLHTLVFLALVFTQEPNWSLSVHLNTLDRLFGTSVARDIAVVCLYLVVPFLALIAIVIFRDNDNQGGKLIENDSSLNWR